MSPNLALLAALLLAVAAPLSHRAQLLFGYRYLVFSVLALLAFARRLSGGDARWMLAAGLCVLAMLLGVLHDRGRVSAEPEPT